MNKCCASTCILKSVMESVPDPIYYKTKDGKYKFVNKAFERLVDLKEVEIIGKTAYDVFGKKLGDIYKESDDRVFDLGTDKFEGDLYLKNKDTKRVEFNKNVVKDSKNEVLGLIGLIYDITDKKRDEDKIKKLIRIKEAMLNIGNSVMKIEKTEEFFELIMSTSLELIEKADIGSVIKVDERDMMKIVANIGFSKELAAAFSLKVEDSFIMQVSNKNEKLTTKHIKLKHINKSKVIQDPTFNVNLKETISAPIYVCGELYGFINMDSKEENVFTEEDIEILDYIKNHVEMAIENRMLYERVIYMSEHDEMTGIYNRRFFEQKVKDELERGTKNSYIAVFDLNKLKYINDNFGHIAGDRYIKKFSKLLSEMSKENEIISRYGGDEFTALLEGNSKEEVEKRIEKMLLKFKANEVTLDGDVVKCSFSYGVTKIKEAETNYDDILMRADLNMYSYKRKNR